MEFDLSFYRDVVESMSDGVYFVDDDRRICFWSSGAERLTGYPATEVVGRTCRDTLLDHVDDHGNLLCQAHCPLSATIIDGRPRDAHVYLTHADGHRHPVWVRASALRDPSGAIVGAVETFSDDTAVSAVRARLAELEPLALTDPLTGLGNRRYLDLQLDARMTEWERRALPFGLLVVDIDRFKEVNDQHGHEVGDEALRLVARTLVFGVPNAAVCRYGGEEFVVVLPRAEGSTLCDTAHRLRALVESSRLTYQRSPIPLTISVGATLVAPGDDLAGIFRRADALLYTAKSAGRNQVACDAPRTGEGTASGPVG